MRTSLWVQHSAIVCLVIFFCVGMMDAMDERVPRSKDRRAQKKSTALQKRTRPPQIGEDDPERRDPQAKRTAQHDDGSLPVKLGEEVGLPEEAVIDPEASRKAASGVFLYALAKAIERSRLERADTGEEAGGKS